jgi:hypothetical protein
LLTRQAMAWRRVGTVALLLLVVATVGELARHRTPSVPDPPKEQLYQELVVIAPADGQWSGWVDTHGVQARWSKNTRNDFIIGTDAGEAYESGAPVPTVRYVRFRAMNGIESRVLVAGQLSFAPVGTVPEPGRVELLPGGKLSALHDTVSAATVGSPPQGVLSPVEEKSRDSLFVALSAQLGASASSMSLGAWTCRTREYCLLHPRRLSKSLPLQGGGSLKWVQVFSTRYDRMLACQKGARCGTLPLTMRGQWRSVLA